MQANQSISTLLAFLSAGDKQAFRKLYLTYYPIFVSYGKAITDDRELVRDTIQELFVWVWQNQAKMVNLDQPENYIYTAFRNNLLSAILKLKNQQNLLQSKFSKTEDSHSNSYEMNLEENGALGHSYLNELIEKLPSKQKEVIYLRFYQEKSFAEIATILSVSPQVAQNYALKALKKLRKHSHILEKLIYPLVAFLIFLY